MKFRIKDFSSKCDQIRRKLPHLLKKFLMKNFIFCAVRFMWDRNSLSLTDTVTSVLHILGKCTVRNLVT